MQVIHSGSPSKNLLEESSLNAIPEETMCEVE
jgi:hypothetical protein